MTPVGNMNSTISLLINCNPDIDIVYKRAVDSESFTLDTRELKEVLGEVPLDNPDVTVWINSYLEENENNLFGGANQ